MKVVHRYFVRGYLWPLFFCSLVFLLMFVFVDCLNNLDEFIKHDTPLRVIAMYYAALVPIVLGQTMPAAVLFSALYFLGHLNKYNEITALKAGGVSGRGILWPIFLIGLIVSAGVLALNETVTPDAAITSTAIRKGLLDTNAPGQGEKKLTNVTLLSGSHMIFARELSVDTGVLHDVIVLQHRSDLTLDAKVTARRGVYDGTRWTLHDVVRYDIDANGDVDGKPQTLAAADLDIKETPLEFIRQDTETQFMNFKQLRDYIHTTKLGGEKSSNRLLVDLYHKIAAPFACFVILLAGTPLALRARRGGALISLGAGLAIVGLYYISIAVSLALGKGGALPAIIAVWLPHAVFALFGIRLLQRYA